MSDISHDLNTAWRALQSTNSSWRMRLVPPALHALGSFPVQSDVQADGMLLSSCWIHYVSQACSVRAQAAACYSTVLYGVA